MSFAGKVALIAGASRGIGAVTARAFGRAGAAVVVAARDEVALTTVAESIRAEGGRALAVPTDVGDAASLERLVGQTLNAFGRLDAAFNNATDRPRPAPLADIYPAEFDRGIRPNIRGTFLGMKYQIPAMLQSGGGRSSTWPLAGPQESPSWPPTSRARRASSASKVAALDYADQGIRVNVVAPGPILTHHLEKAGRKRSARPHRRRR